MEEKNIPKAKIQPAPTREDKRAKLIFWFCLFLAAACGVAVLYYIWFPSRTTFYADCSDTLYWANASWEAGAVFNRDFYYATLQPFGGSLLMLPFVALLGFGLKAHLLGMLAFAVVFMAGLWFFCSSLDISPSKRLVLFSAVLMLLSSSFKLRELMWEHVIYYSLGILFALLLMGLCFRLQRRLNGEACLRQWQTIALLALLFLLAVGIGTDGMQVLVLCTVPWLLALAAERFFDIRSRALSRRNAVAVLLAGVIAVGTAVGLVALRFLSAGITTSYTDQHMVFSPSAQWGEHLLLLPDFWARLMGFNSHNGEAIVSAGGLAELLRLFVGLLLLAVPIVAAAGYAKIRDRQFRLVLWFHGFLSAILLLSHIVGSTANANWRFTPMVFSGALVTVLYLMHLWQKRRRARRATGALAAGLALLCGLNLFTMLTLPVRDGQNQHFYALVNTLEQNGLTYGYADFQVSQPVTVLSDNRVKARYVYMDENGVTPFYYQTEKNWYADVPGQERYFLVLDAGRYDEMKGNEGWRHLEGILEERLESGPYEILVFSENPMGG